MNWIRAEKNEIICWLIVKCVQKNRHKVYIAQTVRKGDNRKLNDYSQRKYVWMLVVRGKRKYYLEKKMPKGKATAENVIQEVSILSPFIAAAAAATTATKSWVYF